MDWLNLHISVLDSPEFLGAEPTDRATWLCLLRFCIGQENRGVIAGGRLWADRKWQQLARVTHDEISRPCDLWRVVGDDIEVNFYPVKKQAEVEAKRQAGKDTVAKRWAKQPSSADSSAISSATRSADTEGEGKGNRNRKAQLEAAGTSFLETPEDEITLAKPAPPPPPSRHLPDLLALCPGLHCTRDNRDDWSATLKLWGWEPLVDAATTLRKSTTGRPIYHNEITDWLDRFYTLKTETAQ